MSVAVILNQNARKVTPKVVRALRALVPAEHLYLSASPDEARAMVRDIVAKGYTHVFSGGGDGTFVGLVNELLAALPVTPEGGPALDKMPVIGLLKLGTGNGLCYDLGIAPGYAHLERALKGEILPTRALPLAEVDGRVTTFTGMGWDAAIVNDFTDWKKEIIHPRLARWAAGLLGYFYCTFVRTIPKESRLTGKVEAVFTNRETVEYDDPRTGKRVRIEDGEVIYRGPANVSGVSTAAYFGYGFKAFPFAGTRPDLMHLRIVGATIFQIVRNLGKLWDGSLEHPGVVDRLVRKVDVHFSQPRPFQMGGDAAGYRSDVRYQMSPYRVNVIDLKEEGK